MSQPFTLKWRFSEGFDRPLLPRKVEKAILRKVGNKLATRVRKSRRIVDAKRTTGQLAKSLKFKMRKDRGAGPVLGVLAPRGIRKDSDGHKHRKPLSNFAVAAFQAALGFDVLAMTAADDDFFFAEVEKEIDAALRDE